jgi:hypothetical protein
LSPPHFFLSQKQVAPLFCPAKYPEQLPLPTGTHSRRLPVAPSSLSILWPAVLSKGGRVWASFGLAQSCPQTLMVSTGAQCSQGFQKTPQRNQSSSWALGSLGDDCLCPWCVCTSQWTPGELLHASQTLVQPSKSPRELFISSKENVLFQSASVSLYSCRIITSCNMHAAPGGGGHEHKVPFLCRIFHGTQFKITLGCILYHGWA